MNLSARESLRQTCPDLYRNISSSQPDNITSSDDVIHKVFLHVDHKPPNEFFINQVLLPYSKNTDYIPTIYSATPHSISMEKVAGEILSSPLNPTGSEINEADSQIAKILLKTCDQLTFTLGPDKALVHGDLGLNNILFRDQGATVIDFEKAKIEDSFSKYKNICQLLCRTWFNRPLQLALALAQLEQVETDDQELFLATLKDAVDAKLSRSTAHYEDCLEMVTLDSPVKTNLLGLIQFTKDYINQDTGSN